MVYFLTALYYEAKDIICHYKMRKIIGITKFQVFKGENEILIISGTGGIKAIIAATYLLTNFQQNEDDIFVNIGTCGSVKNNFREGEVFLCNKLVDNFSKKAFYPDMLFKNPFNEGILESFSNVVNANIEQNIEADIVDQEGVFVYEAVSMFFNPQNIYIIKIVSDMLNSSLVTPQSIERLMREAMPKVYNWLKERVKVKFNNQDIISMEEYKLLKDLSENIKLTSAMDIELKKLSKQYKIRNGYIIDVINKYKNSECKSKIEGKRVFGELKKRLMEL